MTFNTETKTVRNTLIEVSADCSRLSLLDGSTWEVNPGDMPTVATWIPTAELEIKRSGSGLYSHKVTNLEIDVDIRARPLA